MTTAPSESAVPTFSDSALTKKVLSRVCDDMGMMLDRPMLFSVPSTTRENSRVAGKGVIHISFKLAFTCKKSGELGHGAVLVPLAEAISMAGYLAMSPDATIEEDRKLEELDDSTKEGMMEVSSVMASGIEGALRTTHEGEWKVSSLGCQGVSAGVRPAFPYEEGSELITAVMETQIGDFKPYKLILMMPVLSMPEA